MRKDWLFLLLVGAGLSAGATQTVRADRSGLRI